MKSSTTSLWLRPLILAAFLLSAGCGGPPPADVGSSRPAVPTPDSSRLDRYGREQVAAVNARVGALDATEPATEAQRLEFATAYGEAGEDYQAYGFEQAARAAYANAAALDPSDWRWPYLDALLARRDGATKQARAGLKQAYALLHRSEQPNPKQLLAVTWWQGETELQSNHPQAAAEYFRQATSHSPAAIAPWIGLGRAELAAGRAEQALTALQAADRLAPRQPSIRYRMGLAYRALGQLDLAAPLLAKAANGGASIRIHDPLLESVTERARSPAALIRRATDAFRQGRYQAAVRINQEALKLDPESAVAHLNLAGAWVKLQRPRAARAHFERALRLDPKLAIAHRGLAHLDKRQGRRDQALRHLLAAESLAPRDLQTLADLGHLLAEQGDAEGAAKRFDTLLAMRPANERGLLGRARVLDLQGRYDEALASLEQAARLNSGSSAIASALQAYRRLHGQGHGHGGKGADKRPPVSPVQSTP